MESFYNNPISKSLAEIGRATFIEDCARDYTKLMRNMKDRPEELFDALDDMIETVNEMVLDKSNKVNSTAAAIALFCVLGDDDDSPPDEEQNVFLRAALVRSILNETYVKL